MEKRRGMKWLIFTFNLIIRGPAATLPFAPVELQAPGQLEIFPAELMKAADLQHSCRARFDLKTQTGSSNEASVDAGCGAGISEIRRC